MMKKILIVKDSKSKIKIFDNYLIVSTLYESKVIGFKHIKEIYLNKLIKLTPAQCLKLAKSFNVNFINYHGQILGSIKVEI